MTESGAGERARELAAALIKEWREYAIKECPRNEKLSPHGQLAGIALVTGAQSVYTKCADELEAVLPVLTGALAAVRLEEARWWAMRLEAHRGFSKTPKDRIAALERAVEGK